MNQLPKEEIKQALEYVKELDIIASLDPGDGKTLVFSRVPEIPESIKSEEIIATIDICIEYHQRCVFTGEYLGLDEKPPIHQPSADPIKDINFFMNYYKPKLIEEVEKGLAQDEEDAEFEGEIPISPFAKVMMRYKKEKGSED